MIGKADFVASADVFTVGAIGAVVTTAAGAGLTEGMAKIPLEGGTSRIVAGGDNPGFLVEATAGYEPLGAYASAAEIGPDLVDGPLGAYMSAAEMGCGVTGSKVAVAPT